LALAEGSFNFVPLEKIAPTMMAAVVTTEDGGFWKHNGFLRSQFESSLRRNVELGMIRRGASTITMQLVKNLLLSHERTVSRKLQELFLTWVLEQKLSKQRIMEIYLNIVEFGPGIYGIERASRHYFGKPPMDLTGKESAFLATMLPNPVGRHSQWCRGELTEKYAKKVDRVFQFMHDRNRIDDLTWET
jgi:membrane peptidoglycan carboxypeptidase